GQWPYSLFTEGRGIAATVAGTWVSVFWGGLTVGRFLAGVLTDRLGVHRLLRFSMIGVILGAALIVPQVAALNALGMAVTGFMLAPIFPLLIASTRDRVGRAHAPNAIGFQVAAAGLGFAILPGLAGVLAGAIGLEVIGPFLVACALLMWALYEITARWQQTRRVGELASVPGR
ncbi:MAG: MFS transporter, partial [Anaerolineae bacterium]|nr:MFS transporter [Anaerolineae bacterium]